MEYNINDLSELVRRYTVSTIIKNKSFIIAANWKMNKNLKDVYGFIDDLKRMEWDEKNKVILFPPSIYLLLVGEMLKGTKVSYGLQNICWETQGAFTGEISPLMALDTGCQYSIIGHSERRNIFFETDEMIGKKVRAALDSKINVILCVGENLQERQSNLFKKKVYTQIISGLKDVKTEDLSKIIIAYEPVWAIGTGLNANGGQVDEVHNHIKDVLVELFGAAHGKDIPILYGGSVKSDNVRDLALVENVGGFLIGGASLKADEFGKIISLL